MVVPACYRRRHMQLSSEFSVDWVLGMEVIAPAYVRELTFGSFLMDQRSRNLLTQINQRIPAGVDWKAGALNYLNNLFDGDNSGSMRLFHKVKPFISVQDSGLPIREQMLEFTREIGFFAHLLSSLNLPPSASFLDIACGTGWVSHYLSKLGLRVCGFDISLDMIELAKERIAADAFPTTTGRPLDIELFVHDIESAPLGKTEKFDVAILESALHHFVDPIRALMNIKQSLKPNGMVVIIEGCSDGTDDYCREVMLKYDTLERPYTSTELHEIIVCAGFPLQQRMVPLSGFFAPGRLSAISTEDLLCNDRSWNTVVAFNSEKATNHLTLQGAPEPPSYLVNAAGEYIFDLRGEHWIGSTSRLVLTAPGREAVGFIFSTPLPNLYDKPMHLLVKDTLASGSPQHYEIFPSASGDAQLKILLPIHDGSAAYELTASEVFMPAWLSEVDDQRLLSGRVSIVPPADLDSEVDLHIREVKPVDRWMGPNERFQPVIGVSPEICLRFTSPIPRRRLQAQHLYIRVGDGRQHHHLTLRPTWFHESSAVLRLNGLTKADVLQIQSSDSFSPAWNGDDDSRLLSYRITQVL